VLTPFFGTGVVNDKENDVADGSWPMLKQSWPIGRCDAAANGVELALIVQLS
jgi:hypothetical protein